jgi:hypothetical protein
MKKTITIVVACILSFSVLSQTAKKQLYNTHLTLNGRIPLSQNVFGTSQQKNKLKSGNETMQKLDSFITLDYDTTLHIWSKRQKEVYTYNADGYIRLKIDYSNINNVWRKQDSSLYNYDSNGNNTIIYSYYFNGQDWKKLDSIVNTYNGNISEYDYSYFNGIWSLIYASKNIYTSDSNGVKRLNIGQTFNMNSKSFQNSDSLVYSYPAKNLIEINAFNWDTVTNKWSSQSSDSIGILFDSNNNMTTFSGLETTSDTQNGKVLSTATIKVKEVFTFNTDINTSNVIEPEYTLNTLLAFHNQNEITSNSKFELREAIWVQTDSTTNYYSDTVLTHNTIVADSDINIYPNPVSNFVTISMHNNATLQIFSMSAEMLLSQQISNNESVSLIDIPEGIYLVKIITKNDVVTKTLIKIRN